MGLFWVDSTRNIKKSYADFFDDINKLAKIDQIIISENPYDILLSFSKALCCGLNIEMFDYDARFFHGSVQEKFESRTINLSNCEKIENYKELTNQIDRSKNRFHLAMYTSGTTGKPKKIIHNYSSLTRNIKIKDFFKDDVWAFAYNPTHFAGLQVFLQALFNTNAMIYIFEEKKSLIEDLLSSYNVTRISATPTFYRNTLPYLDNEISSVKTVTSGGEKFDSSLESLIKQKFPNAKIRNIYASTEAGTLFGSRGEKFIINDELKGKVKVSKNNELLIHKSLLAESEELKVVNGWYHTGDIVELGGDDTIRFLSRNSDFINVGGYRVDPIEIENFLLKLPYITEALIYGRKNKITGNILVAEIVKKGGEIPDAYLNKKIREYLRLNLQEWKIPKIIKYVDNIDVTRTGKKSRKK